MPTPTPREAFRLHLATVAARAKGIKALPPEVQQANREEVATSLNFVIRDSDCTEAEKQILRLVLGVAVLDLPAIETVSSVFGGRLTAAPEPAPSVSAVGEEVLCLLNDDGVYRAFLVDRIIDSVTLGGLADKLAGEDCSHSVVMLESLPPDPVPLEETLDLVKAALDRHQYASEAVDEIRQILGLPQRQLTRSTGEVDVLARSLG